MKSREQEGLGGDRNERAKPPKVTKWTAVVAAAVARGGGCRTASWCQVTLQLTGRRHHRVEGEPASRRTVLDSLAL